MQRLCETSTTFTLLFCGLLQPKAAFLFPFSFPSSKQGHWVGGSLIFCSKVPPGAVSLFWGSPQGRGCAWGRSQGWGRVGISGGATPEHSWLELPLGSGCAGTSRVASALLGNPRAASPNNSCICLFRTTSGVTNY